MSSGCQISVSSCNLVSVEHIGRAMPALPPSQQHMNVSLKIPLGLMLAHFCIGRHKNSVMPQSPLTAILTLHMLGHSLVFHNQVHSIGATVHSSAIIS